MHNSDDQNHQNKRPHFKSIGARRESQHVWRMEQVLKYASLGYNQAEIAEVLKISQSWVSRSITAITKAAKEDIEHHVKETLPYERKKALALFENVKRRAIEIADKESIGERDRISALSLAKDAAKEIWALNSQGEHLKTAINVAAGLQEKLERKETNNNISNSRLS
jgi:predicted transcriptional regulator